MIDFSKNPKNPTRCQANLGKKWIFLEKRALLAFKYSNYLPWCSNSENTNVPFLKKMPNWQADEQTDNGGFIGTSEGRGSNKLSDSLYQMEYFWHILTNTG